MTHDEALRLADAGLCLMPAQVRALYARWQALRTAAADVIAANERLCNCINEFEPFDMAACGEYRDRLDTMIMRLAAALATEDAAHDR